MMQKALRFFFAFVLKHPMTILVITGALTIASAISIFYINIETDITALLPTNSAVSASFRRAIATYKTLDFTLVVIEADKPGKESLLIEAADALAPALDNPAYIYSVDYKLDPRLRAYYTEDLEAKLSLLLESKDFEAGISHFAPDTLESYMLRLASYLKTFPFPYLQNRLLNDPFDMAVIFANRLIAGRVPSHFPIRNGHIISADGKMLLMFLRPLEPPSDLKFSTALVAFLDRVRDVLIKKDPRYKDRLTVSFYGSHVEMVDNTRIVRRDLIETLVTSLVGVLALFFIVFGRKKALFYVGIPLMTGILWTLGLTYLVLGRLTVVTFAFGAVLIGLGIDFGIHIYNRFLEERGRRDQKSVYRALNTALVKTGEGTLLGAMTTALAFFGMYFTSFRGFREFGLVAGCGILCCLISVFLLLPILIRYLAPHREEIKKQDTATLGLQRLYKVVSEYPRIIVILGLVASVYFAYQARSLRFDEKFGALKQPMQNYEELRRRIAERFALPSHKIIAVVSDATLQGALEKIDRLYENLARQNQYNILSCDTLRTFLPSIKTQRESKKNIRDTIGNRYEPLKKRILAQAQRAGLSPAALEPFFARLQRLKESAEDETQFLVYEDMRDPFMIRLVQGYLVKTTRQYSVVTRIYPPEGVWQTDVPPAFLNALKEGVGDVDFTGLAIVTHEIQDMVKRDLAAIILLVAGAIFVVLLLYFGNLAKALFAIFPVLLGSLWMLGTVQILGIELNFLNVVVMPMIIGVGVDNSIHLVQRYYERSSDAGEKNGSPHLGDLRRAVARTGRALVMTSLTTIVGFGSLALADFKGVREMGLISILGMAYTLIVSLAILPALLIIWGERHTLWDIISRDNGEIR